MKLNVKHLTPCTQDLLQTAPDLEISCFPFQTEAIIKSLKKPNGTEGMLTRGINWFSHYVSYQIVSWPSKA